MTVFDSLVDPLAHSSTSDKTPTRNKWVLISLDIKTFQLTGVSSRGSDQSIGDPGANTCIREATRLPAPGYTLDLVAYGVYRFFRSTLEIPDGLSRQKDG